MTEMVYRNAFGRTRAATSSEIAQRETEARREFLAGYLPTLSEKFKQRGVKDIAIGVVGSVEKGKACPESDIDLLISQQDTDSLSGVISAGSDIEYEILDDELPYRIHFWYGRLMTPENEKSFVK